MESSGLGGFFGNLVDLPGNFYRAVIRHGKPDSDRARAQTVFNNFGLHVHATRVHPRSLLLTTTFGLGIALASLFIILTVTGILLMVYYRPSLGFAYDSIKDLYYIVPAGRIIRNIHRWGAHLMVLLVLLHMARVFYTSAYKSPREFNWVVGMLLFVLTLALSFTGYLLPWDQLAYWAIVIGSNIAASPNELTEALGLGSAFRIGDLQKELLLGSSAIGADALIRFYILHVIVLPIITAGLIGLHIWRIRKDGGLARPGGTPTAAGKGTGSMTLRAESPKDVQTKTTGLMCVVKGDSPHVGINHEETVPSWPYLMRAELLVFMVVMLICVALGYYFDAPLKEAANPSIPENPAKAPWYFLGLQEIVSYSAFIGGIVIPGLSVVGLALVPFLDREKEESGVWFSGPRGKKITFITALFALATSITAVAIPVKYGWLRDWDQDISQLWIILCNPGSILVALYMAWSVAVIKFTRSTRMGAIALFTCFLVGFVILTYVGTFLRGPNWGFYWSTSEWPKH